MATTLILIFGTLFAFAVLSAIYDATRAASHIIKTNRRTTSGPIARIRDRN